MEVQDESSLIAIKDAAKECKDCSLWANATQTVFGEGSPYAKVVLIGEQPGDQEDLQGHPFVGPAGKLLDKALESAGVDRKTVYITNAVKHFKWTSRGKRRIHKTPGQREIDACHQWIEREIHIIKPRVIVCLGATAAKAILGKDFKVSTQRGHLIESHLAKFAFATLHPSAILRIQEADARQETYEQFVQDLSLIKKALN
jgi:DNA polymerase